MSSSSGDEIPATLVTQENRELTLVRRFRRFFPNFNIIGLVVRELHLSEVEGVEMSVFFFLNLSKVIVSSKA